jgi:hypothetical protein
LPDRLFDERWLFSMQVALDHLDAVGQPTLEFGEEGLVALWIAERSTLDTVATRAALWN